MWITGTFIGLDNVALRRALLVKIRFYGELGQKLGAEIDVSPPPGTDTVVELRNVLAEMFPDASTDLKLRSRACIADTIVGEGYELAGTEMVEFFPPLSGG
jgi:molybdopterin converting factor small subunit